MRIHDRDIAALLRTRSQKCLDGDLVKEISKRTGIPESEVIRLAWDKVEKLVDDFVSRYRTEKNWSTCPYYRHDDDCDCRGMGGDR